MVDFTLSKSRFLSGYQCPKRLYLEVYQPDLIPPPDSLNESLFEQGRQIGVLATKLYPGGLRISQNPKDFSAAAKETRVLMGDTDAPAVFEAAFEAEGLRVIVDILSRKAVSSWDLIEVKSGTAVKELNILEVAFQKYVLNLVGVDIDKSYITILNKEYVCHGGEPVLDELFCMVDCTNKVNQLQLNIPGIVRVLNSIISDGFAPDMDAGVHCKYPFKCPFLNHCVTSQSEHAIQNFYMMSQAKKAALAAMDISDIRDIPLQFELTPIQKRIKESITTGIPYFDPKIKEVLRNLKKPVHFLDFETFSPAVPRYPGTGLYEMIPFQWSMHIEDENSSLFHRSFLAEGINDPRPDFIRSLIDAVAESGDIVIYTNYEASVLRSLIPLFPGLAADIEALIDRFVDIHALIRKYVYHPGFGQSFSLKKVLPALLPEIGYEDLDIQNGAVASIQFMLTFNEDDEKRRKSIRQKLLDYCHRDTFALVELRRYLTEEI